MSRNAVACRGSVAALPGGLPRQVREAGVLLVDDCALQRDLLRDQLQLIGVERVYEAGDGESALALIEGLPMRPALSVMDLEMPGADGFETMRRLARRFPGLPMLVLSGGDRAVLESIGPFADLVGIDLVGVESKPLPLQRLRLLLGRCRGFGPRSVQRTPPMAAFEVHRALRAGWILPHFQPKIDLATGRLEGVEVLARWEAPDGSRCPPSQFIPVAEREELIDELSFSLLESTLPWLDRWTKAGLAPGVSLNVSGRSLANPRFADRLVERVASSGHAPGRFVLEVTESAIAHDPAEAIACMSRFRLRGFGLSIDDYGTGYSSLQRLASTPFTELKVDRSFVRHAGDSPRQHAVLQSAIEIGCKLGLVTVAEGIETSEELRMVQEMGCSHAQGYLFAPAMPGELLLDWVRVSGRAVQGSHATS